MVIKNQLDKRKYRKLVLAELMFGGRLSLIILALYCLLWRIMYSIAKVGQLKRNLPIFLGTAFLLLLVLILVIIFYIKQMKNDFIYKSGTEVNIDSTQLTIQLREFDDKVVYKWDDLTKIKENNKWYFLFFKDKSIFPVSKNIESSSLEELKEFFPSYTPIRKSYKKLTAAGLLLITVIGSYYVGKCAVNFNGDLSWKIRELKTDKKVSVNEINLYTSKLEGIIKYVQDKEKLETNLMTNSIDIKFKKDGTITSIDTYIYGFDENYNLKSGYLVYYDKTKGDKITIHKQDWGSGGTTKYNPDNALPIVINMMNKMPIEQDVKQWNESGYAIMYKGIRSFGYNLEGIIFIDKDGKITTPKIAQKEIKGPAVSVYCPGKEQSLIPKRYIYKK